MGGWKRGLYARAGGLAGPRKPLSCGDCSLAAGVPACVNLTCQRRQSQTCPHKGMLCGTNAL